MAWLGWASQSIMAQEIIPPQPRIPVGEQGSVTDNGLWIISQDWDTEWRFWGHVPFDPEQNPWNRRFGRNYWTPVLFTPKRAAFTTDIFGTKWYRLDDLAKDISLLDYNLTQLAAKWLPPSSLPYLDVGIPEMSAIRLTGIRVDTVGNRLFLTYSSSLRIVPKSSSNFSQLVTGNGAPLKIEVIIRGIERGIGPHENNGAPLPNIWLPGSTSTFSTRLVTDGVTSPLAYWDVLKGTNAMAGIPSTIQDFENCFLDGARLMDDSTGRHAMGHIENPWRPFVVTLFSGESEEEFRSFVEYIEEDLADDTQGMDFRFWSFMPEELPPSHLPSIGQFGIFSAVGAGVASVSECESLLTLVVRRTGGTTGEAKVRVSTTAMTAGTTDFAPVDTIVAFGPGETQKRVIISVFPDDQAEASESFMVGIDDAVGAHLSTSRSVTVSIINCVDPEVGEEVPFPWNENPGTGGQGGLIAVSDDFNDNAIAAQKWGFNGSYGATNLIKEIGQHLEHSTTSTDFCFSSLPWIGSQITYDRNWEVIVDVANLQTAPVSGGSTSSSLGLSIYPADDEENDKSIFLDLMAIRSAGAIQRRIHAGLGDLTDYVVPDASNRVAFRLSFDAEMKTIRASYDMDAATNGYNWTRLATFGISPAGGGTTSLDNQNWKMSGVDAFSIEISGFSHGHAVAAGEMYMDDLRVGTSSAASFENWQFARFGSATADISFSADKDSDGLRNIIEYAFNLNPLRSGDKAVVPAVGTVGLPYIHRAAEPSGQALQVEYVRRKSASSPGITYEVQFSSDLSSVGAAAWKAASGPAIVTSINDIWERVVVLDVEGIGGTKRFGRLKISESQ
jgi:hypothetical protein